MSDNVCPKCGKPYNTIGGCMCNQWTGNEQWLVTKTEYDGQLAEIARLRSELERAEGERDDWKQGYEFWLDKYYHTLAELNEARKWAKYFLSVTRIYSRHLGYALVVPKFPKKGELK